MPISIVCALGRHAVRSSLFVSAGNAGVVLGSAIGGLFIDTFGMPGAIGCGLIFSVLPVLVIAAKALLYCAKPPRVDAVSAAH